MPVLQGVDELGVDGDHAAGDEADGRGAGGELRRGRSGGDLGNRTDGGGVAEQPDEGLANHPEGRDDDRGEHGAKPVPQLPSGAEEERLDGGLGDVQGLRKLLVGQPGELPHDESLALLRREILDRRPESCEVGLPDRRVQWIGPVAGAVRIGLGERLTHPVARARPALVAGDRRQPGGRLTRLRSAEQAAIRGEECLLRGILGLRCVAQEHATETEHHTAVALEQLGCPAPGLVGRQPAGFENRLGAARHYGVASVRDEHKAPAAFPRVATRLGAGAAFVPSFMTDGPVLSPVR